MRTVQSTPSRYRGLRAESEYSRASLRKVGEMEKSIRRDLTWPYSPTGEFSVSLIQMSVSELGLRRSLR